MGTSPGRGGIRTTCEFICGLPSLLVPLCAGIVFYLLNTYCEPDLRFYVGIQYDSQEANKETREFVPQLQRPVGKARVLGVSLCRRPTLLPWSVVSWSLDLGDEPLFGEHSGF